MLPVCCPECGRYEFFNPDIVEKDPFRAYLMEQDKKEAEKSILNI